MFCFLLWLIFLFDCLSGVYIFLFDPTWPNVGGKNDWKGMKKGGKIHIFSPIGKKYAYFPPNWLKIYKIAQKSLKIFACGAQPLIISNFIGQKYKSRRGGGKNMNFKFGIHPCCLHMFWQTWDKFIPFFFFLCYFFLLPLFGTLFLKRQYFLKITLSAIFP